MWYYFMILTNHKYINTHYNEGVLILHVVGVAAAAVAVDVDVAAVC